VGGDELGDGDGLGDREGRCRGRAALGSSPLTGIMPTAATAAALGNAQ
jgi:hypothetical protein